MKKEGLILLAIFVLSLSFISASDYSIEFNQIADKLVVKQNISGNYLSYVDSSILEKTSSGYVFIKKLEFNQSFEQATIKLNLDEGFIINSQEAFPNNYLLETDGRTISLIWKLENMTAGSGFAIFVAIKDTNSSSIWKIILVIVIVLILLVGSWVLYFKKNKSKSTEKFEQHLLDSEKRVIEELKKADRNELWQKQLQLKMDFSKAKLSRVIRNLESRELIRKIPMGNTNKICLK